HSTASMCFAIILALFFVSLYSALSEYFTRVVDDGRIARIEVLGRRNGERLLSQKDVEELSNLSWAKGPAFSGITSTEEILNKQRQKGKPAVRTAVGYWIREMRFARNPAITNTLFSTETSLSVVSSSVADPILSTIDRIDAGQINDRAPETLKDVFDSSP